MSTKKIREVLTRLAENPVAAGDPLVQGAFAEVDAIEKAGRYGYLMMTGDIHMAKRDEMRAADKVFSAIYDETGRSEG